MGYFNEATITQWRARLARAGVTMTGPLTKTIVIPDSSGQGNEQVQVVKLCAPEDYDHYNNECGASYGPMRAAVAMYDAWRTPSADEWFRIVTTVPEIIGAGNPPLSADRALYGYFANTHKDAVREALAEIGKGAGVLVMDWTRYQKRAMKHEWDDQVAHGRNPITIWSHSQPFSDLIYLPVRFAAEELKSERLAQVARNLAPGTEWYVQHQSLGDAMDSARDKARFNRFVLVAGGILTAGYLSTVGLGTGAAASTGGATLAEEAALLGIAETGGTAAVASGAGTVAAASVAEEAAALGIAETGAAGIGQAGAASASVGGALEQVGAQVVKAGTALAQTVGKAVLGTAAAAVVNELGPDQPGPAAQQGAGAPASSSSMLLGLLMVGGAALAALR